MTKLCDLARKYGTDKALFYTPFYSELFKDRRDSVRKVLEIGIGSPETMLSSVCRMGLTTYTPGASLFMWRDYFPNADVVGLDHDTNTFVNEERIRSFYFDQEEIVNDDPLFKCIGEDFDLIIDDGQHTFDSQLRTILRMRRYLNSGGVYIVEDIGNWGIELVDRIMEEPGQASLVDFGEARIITVTN